MITRKTHHKQNTKCWIGMGHCLYIKPVSFEQFFQCTHSSLNGLGELCQSPTTLNNLTPSTVAFFSSTFEDQGNRYFCIVFFTPKAHCPGWLTPGHIFLFLPKLYLLWLCHLILLGPERLKNIWYQLSYSCLHLAGFELSLP